MADHSIYRYAFPALAAAILGACATEEAFLPPPLSGMRKDAPLLLKSPDAQRKAAATTEVTVTETPKPPVLKRLDTIKEPPPPAPPGKEKADITLMFDQLPLPNFIQVVYGNILKTNFNVDAQVASRTDLVTLRTAQPQTPSQVRETARMLLKSYGIAVTDVGSFLRIVPDNTLQGYAPEIRRGRALPDTPLPLRPIFQLVELDAVNTGEVAVWIGRMFGQKIALQEDGSRNALMISGQSEDVSAALETIRILDQPRMRGNSSTRISPIFWSADAMSQKLIEILSAEGYRVAGTGSASTPIIVLPIQAINAIMVFASDPAVIAHIVHWAQELDKPAQKGGGFFTYQARYTDGEVLAKTIRELLAGIPGPAQPVVGGIGVPPPAQARAGVVVNSATNSLIFRGNMEDYTSILNLLKELDQPARAALIEVTVAEVTLSDAEQLGIEWSYNRSNANGTITAGTSGGLGIGTGGLTINLLRPDASPRMLINALASNNRAKVLSSPRILARNGETATIQVGQEVPVITSQQTTPTTGSTGSILQSVQYRSTGVILKVKPIIHAGDRIDLEVSQEVSTAQSTTTGVSTSPTISTRRVDTKLSLKDGATVLLGGLMSSNQSNTRGGIPILKDIPGLGQLFRVDTETTNKTELIVLITPYIMSDDKDAQAITNAFRNQLGNWAKTRAAPGMPPTTEPLQLKGDAPALSMPGAKPQALPSANEGQQPLPQPLTHLPAQGTVPPVPLAAPVTAPSPEQPATPTSPPASVRP
jgi:general secretion pathway protein D